MKYTTTFAVIGFCALTFVATAAWRANAAPLRNGFDRGAIVQRIIEKLELTEEQVTQIKAELRAQKDTVIPLVKELFAARRDLRQAIHEQSDNETAIRAAAAKVATIEADLAVERAKLSARIRPLLTDEQIAKLKEFERRLDEAAFEAFRTMGRRLEE